VKTSCSKQAYFVRIKNRFMDFQYLEVSQEFKTYLLKSRAFFEKHSEGMLVENHYQHNLEPNFWEHMIKQVLSNASSFDGELGFEFGSGAGRNLVNLLVSANFRRVDGIDISKSNARNSQRFVEEKIGASKTICLEGNGYSCLPFPSGQYAYAISHQVFIHIPNRKLRLCILKDLQRILKQGGCLVIHFKHMHKSVAYESNYNNFPMNVTVNPSDTELIEQDFLSAGFSSVTIKEVKNWVDGKLEFFVTAIK